MLLTGAGPGQHVYTFGGDLRARVRLTAGDGLDREARLVQFGGQPVRVEEAERDVDRGPEPLGRVPHLLARVDGQQEQALVDEDAAELGERGPQEIGRASCRERVCLAV